MYQDSQRMYFTSPPQKDDSINQSINYKHIVGLTLGGVLPFFFILRLANSQPMQSWWDILFVSSGAIWVVITANLVFVEIFTAARLRRYAKAVDADRVKLGKRLFTLEDMLSAETQRAEFSRPLMLLPLAEKYDYILEIHSVPPDLIDVIPDFDLEKT